MLRKFAGGKSIAMNSELKEMNVEKVEYYQLMKAFRLMHTAKSMAELYEANKDVASKYVHATSRGHEAVQIACGLMLNEHDFAFPYYRDDAFLLAMGFNPKQLMCQLLAKGTDPFSGGRTYYSHPSFNQPGFPKIPHQSSATGMQAIPATGVALGMQYKEVSSIATAEESKSLVVCSLGDACITEGEVSEAFQMASLKKLPILFLVQDNEWDISAKVKEFRAQTAYEFAAGFKGLEAYTVDGTDYEATFDVLAKAMKTIREERRPVLVHATVPLLNHHTSGVRKEWYRDDLEEAATRDPYPKLRAKVLEYMTSAELEAIEAEIESYVAQSYELALAEPEPDVNTLTHHVFAPTPITMEQGERAPKGAETVIMVDAALFAIRELMNKHKECLLYGQDVGGRLGGVFREAATLAQQYGDHRVFNTPIQEAFIIGSTVGTSAVGLKPIVEVQFADYIWPGLNQLFTEVSRSCYLSEGKWPVSNILRVPIGAYGSGGPYHSSSVESVLTSIKGIKIAYPSCAADLKGLMKAAYYDPNPVVMLEHKGLYWSKVKGTEAAKSVEPSEDYILPFGKARMVKEAAESKNVLIVTYGMGVHWALQAEKELKGQLGILDLRTLSPLDTEMIFAKTAEYNKVLVLTEEPIGNSFAMALAGLIQMNCFEHLDAPIKIIGAVDLPAIPLNSALEQAMLPNSTKLLTALNELIAY